MDWIRPLATGGDLLLESWGVLGTQAACVAGNTGLATPPGQQGEGQLMAGKAHPPTPTHTPPLTGVEEKVNGSQETQMALGRKGKMPTGPARGPGLWL
jgi:hypothetical protein